MDSIVRTTKSNSDITYANNKIDASLLRLIYLALKKHSLPANSIFTSIGIDPKFLNSSDYISHQVIEKLYDRLDGYDYLDSLPELVYDVFQFPFLRYIDSSPYEAKNIESMLYVLSNLPLKISSFVKATIQKDRDFATLKFQSALSDYKVNQTSLEIGVYLTVKIATQIFPHVSGGIVNVILPKESYRDGVETIKNIPIIYSDKKVFCVVFQRSLSTTINVFSPSHRDIVGLKSILNVNNNGDVDILSSVQTIIKEHLNSSSLNIALVAEKMHISVKTIQRRLFGLNTTFTLLVQQQKIELAVHLLKEGKLSIKQISFELGFNSPSSFTRAFKGWTGVLPSTYQQKFVALSLNIET